MAPQRLFWRRRSRKGPRHFPRMVNGWPTSPMSPGIPRCTCYPTRVREEILAAGFQDHDIGTILGVDDRTGAGGANVLTHSALRADWTNGPLQALPGGAGMRVALRRTLRVGDRTGEPIEDLGIVRDEEHNMTRDDLLQGNTDLLDRAGEILAQGTPREFDVTLSPQGQMMTVDISSLNVSSVDVFSDGRPLRQSTTISAGNNSFDVINPGSGANVLIEGFDEGNLVASRKISIP